MKHNNLYLGLVLPSVGWQSLIKTIGIDVNVFDLIVMVCLLIKDKLFRTT
jgi:hypothetical protein